MHVCLRSLRGDQALFFERVREATDSPGLTYCSPKMTIAIYYCGVRDDGRLAAEIRVRGELDRRRAIREGGSQLVAVTHDERRRRGQSRQVFEQVSNDDDLDDLTARAVQKRRCGARAIYKLVSDHG